MTLRDAILEAINGPCNDACGQDGVVNSDAWAGLIAEAVAEWAQATLVTQSVLASLVADAIWPIVTVEL